AGWLAAKGDSCDVQSRRASSMEALVQVFEKAQARTLESAAYGVQQLRIGPVVGNAQLALAELKIAAGDADEGGNLARAVSESSAGRDVLAQAQLVLAHAAKERTPRDL